MPEKTAIIIGAGPAGLTAAYELVTRSDIKPLVFEADTQVGGIAKTVLYKGNRIDFGGHRFFTKSKRVLDWWFKFLPMQACDPNALPLSYQENATDSGPDPATDDEVMLVMQRRSRIFFQRAFFDYPISLSLKTVGKLGYGRTILVALSYIKSFFFPIRPEENLEVFFINRFGRRLYELFFRSYTEKVWGVPCEEISADWGAQRVKGLSIYRAIAHALRGLLRRAASPGETETSLVEQFFYPKYGPGQLWEKVAEKVREKGGKIRLEHKVVAIERCGERIEAVVVEDLATGNRDRIAGDYFFSSMPVNELIAQLDEPAPGEVVRIASNLAFRDFITVGVLAKSLSVSPKIRVDDSPCGIADNWLYIQEPDVRVGRMQLFNNWSPYMVGDPNTAWIAMEYFANEGDSLWSIPDEDFGAFAMKELTQLGLAQPEDLLDHIVLRVPKAYPAYFGAYEDFGKIRQFLDPLENLYPIGRNGMHRYNNQDHSMLAAMTAVDLILAGDYDKEALWAVNTESSYHEEE